MKDICFTIVIPVHNGMPFIKECVESALLQDYKNYNIIILENLSEDGTLEYLDNLNSDKITIIKSDRLLTIEENWARIKNLKMNEYLSILMADDYLETDYLSSIYEMIKKYPKCNIYRSNINLINDKSKKIFKSNINEKITIYDYLKGRLKHTYTETAAGYCIKSSKYKEIGGIDCKYKLMHTDDKLVMESIEENNYMAVSPNYSANYRCHTGSESGSPNIEAAINGYNYWLNWIYSLKDKRLNKIIYKYLPYHLIQIARFFTPEEMNKHKEIYPLFEINEKDLMHIFIFYKLTIKKKIKQILNFCFGINKGS